MKSTSKIFACIVLALAFLSLAVVPALAQSTTPPEGAPLPTQALGADQIIIIGILASVLAQLFKLAAVKIKNVVLGRKIITIIMFCLSLVMAYVWAKPALPTWPAPVEDPGVYAGLVIDFVAKLVAVGGALIGFGMAVYNLLLQKFFELIGWQTPSTAKALAPQKTLPM
jgi:uncharacterized membrane protein YedE/YeeE